LATIPIERKATVTRTRRITRCATLIWRLSDQANTATLKMYVASQRNERQTTTVLGTNRTSRDVRSSVAIGGKRT
jgi:hypothetical protein